MIFPDLDAAILAINNEVKSGAGLYSPFQPRRSSKNMGITGHVGAFLEPDNGKEKWWATSLNDPTLTLDQTVQAGVSSRLVFVRFMRILCPMSLSSASIELVNVDPPSPSVEVEGIRSAGPETVMLTCIIWRKSAVT